jgi:hypothetical protein
MVVRDKNLADALMSFTLSRTVCLAQGDSLPLDRVRQPRELDAKERIAADLDAGDRVRQLGIDCGLLALVRLSFD